jgi:RNA polymerase sigma-70 factor (ECF subfamily)
MPPAPHEYLGPVAIGDFWRSSAAGRAGRRFRLVPTHANTQPAFACYLPDHPGGPAPFTGVVVLTLAGPGVGGVTRFLDRDLAHPFGLSPFLEPAAAEGPLEAGAR